jgi:lysophospholipase L1-like esterase
VIAVEPRWTRKILLMLAMLVLSSLSVELALNYYANQVESRPRRYQFDSRLGYAFRPNLDLVIRSSTGEHYEFRTDARGYRIASVTNEHVPSSHRIEIMGDSFVEGSGIRVEERFDYTMRKLLPDWDIRARGCGGYGTDQQLLATQALDASAKRAEIVVLVTCGNDFHDILRRSHAARPKPWAELRGEQLLFHPPQVTLLSRLRDVSYLAELIARLGQVRSEFNSAALAASAPLYTRLVLAIREEFPADTHFVVVHHSDSMAEGVDLVAAFAELKAVGIPVLALDETLGTPESRVSNFLGKDDGHWNAQGHRIAGETIAEFIMSSRAGSLQAEAAP